MLIILLCYISGLFIGTSFKSSYLNSIAVFEVLIFFKEKFHTYIFFKKFFFLDVLACISFSVTYYQTCYTYDTKASCMTVIKQCRKTRCQQLSGGKRLSLIWNVLGLASVHLEKVAMDIMTKSSTLGTLGVFKFHFVSCNKQTFSHSLQTYKFFFGLF